LTETSFTSNWGTGEYALVNWSGHGWPDGAYRTIWAWDDGDGVPESTNGELQSTRFVGLWSPRLDDDHPSLVFAISCDVGYPEPNPYGNLGIDLLTLPGWGASAGIVSSARPAAISADWKHDPGGTEQICYEFNRCLIAESKKVGDALYVGKFRAHRDYGWDRVYEYMNLYNFNLFGDPALALSRSVAGGPVVEVDAGGSFPHLRLTGPSPFSETTTMILDLPARTETRVTVHDVGGRTVATLLAGMVEPGPQVATWNGTDDAGLPQAKGHYFVVARAEGWRSSLRVILVD
jgi:hypothetical protein